VIVALLERLIAWMDRQLGTFELTRPVVVQHGSAWLRIAPDQEPRRFTTESAALEYAGG
jgi:hypothetical protein